jgi:tetratricopeptide (TPR) repeat protein
MNNRFFSFKKATEKDYYKKNPGGNALRRGKIFLVLLAAFWLICGCESQKDRAEKSHIHYKRGMRYIRELNMKEAILELRYAIHLDPSFETPYYQLGVVYQKVGAFDNAIEYYQAFLKFNPDHLDTHIRLAETYKSQKQDEEAISEAEYIINRVPIDSEIAIDMHNLIGEIYLYNRKELEPALYHFRKVMERRPEMLAPYISFAKYYLKNKNTDKARELLQRALTVSPDSLPVLKTLIELYTETEDWDNLILTYQNIIKNYPTLTEMSLDLAEVFIKLKRYPEAKNVAIKVYKEDHTNPKARYILGVVTFQQGEYQIAEEQFLYLANLSYKPEQTFSRLATIYKKTGDIKKALDCYEKLLFLRPDLFEARYYSLLLSLKSKDYYKSEKAALVLKSHLYEFHEVDFYLGKAQLFQGKILDAISSLQDYLQVGYKTSSKTSKYTFYKLAYPSLLPPEEFQQKNQAHNQVEGLYLLGLAYLMADQNEKAAEELEKLVFEEPNLPFGFMLAAIAYHRLGDYEKALKHCRITEVLVKVDRSLVNFIKANIYASQWDLEKARQLLRLAKGALYSYNFSSIDITSYPSVAEPNSLADLSLAVMILRNNWREKAEKLCNRVLKSNPKNPVANFIIDNMYILINEYYSQQTQLADQADRITIPVDYD